MRILTLLADESALGDARSLAHEIADFNRAIDFRLRFLNIEIEVTFAAPAGVVEKMDSDLGKQHELPAAGPLEAAAGLALLLDRERPALLLIAGGGPLRDAGVAAAGVVGTRLAFFGTDRAAERGVEALDLGEDARIAVEKMTGVAREIG